MQELEWLWFLLLKRIIMALSSMVLEDEVSTIIKRERVFDREREREREREGDIGLVRHGWPKKSILTTSVTLEFNNWSDPSWRHFDARWRRWRYERPTRDVMKSKAGKRFSSSRWSDVPLFIERWWVWDRWRPLSRWQETNNSCWAVQKGKIWLTRNSTT